MRIVPTDKGLKNLLQTQRKQAEERANKDAERVSKQAGKKSTLPPPGYKPEFEPERFLIRITHSSKNPEAEIRHYLEKKVMRIDDDEGLPFVWLTMYQESDTYTGHMSGKQVYFPLEYIYEVIDQLTDLADKCEKAKIE